MQKTWHLQEVPETSLIQHLQKELTIPPIIAQLLLQRGITTYAQARSFFRPQIDDLHDPFLMKGMKDAVALLQEVRQKNEKILIFGDYDVDGTSAVALVSLFLEKYGFNIDFYIPDRYKEGYGVSIQGVEYAIKTKCTLIISLDCGITAIEQVDYAQTNNINFIVCDHHLPGERLPDAIVLNPKQVDCNYPYKELCGCGVGFKLAQAFTLQMGDATDFLYTLLDLVAIAIAADIVPVTGENRILAHYGLKAINSDKQRRGIRYLLQKAKKNDKVLTLSDVVFTIAPRINAAGRLETGKHAVEILRGENESALKMMAEKIEQLNTQRKELDKAITEDILKKVANIPQYDKKYTTVVCEEGWHKGVVGIVASRLMDTYFRPTVVLSANGPTASGSVRSVPGFNVYEALKQCEATLLQFGGHEAAAGITIELSRLPEFQEKFEQVVQTTILNEQRIRKAKIDAEIGFDEIFTAQDNPSKIPKIKRLLNEFEPTGPGNMKPVFIARNVFIDPEQSRVVGETHYKLSLTQKGYPFKINGIGFHLGEKWKELGTDFPVDIVFTMEENTWNEKTSLQLNIKDIRKASYF
jgi:single-stranded-DNA-specific exonuclease